jgi:hypothetical protein
MAYRSDPQFVVLHAVMIKGFADRGLIVDITALPEDDVVGWLEEAHKANHALRREGRISGWMLTPGGRTRHAELLDAELVGSGAGAALAEIHSAKSAIKSRFNQVCTDWQLRQAGTDLVPNRHDDPPMTMR